MKYLTYIIILITIMSLGLASCSTQQQVTPNGGTNQNQAQSITINEAGFSASVGPIHNNIANGVITTNIQSVPADARQILFILKPKNLPATENPFAAPNVVAKFLDPTPQQITIDTSSVANGDYELYFGVSPKEAGQGWIVETRTNFAIQN